MERILFITSTRIGDAVINSGVLDYLVRTRPEAQFTIACGHLPADLFAHTPRLERLIVVRKRPMGGHWFGLWRRVAGTKWDLVVDLRSSATAWMLNAKERAILKQSQVPVHKVREAADLLRLETPPAPRLYMDPDAEARAASLFPTGCKLLAVCPSASLPYKTWPGQRFGELVKRLVSPDGAMAGAAVAIFGGPGDEEAAEPIREAVADAGVSDFTGQLSLPETAAYLARVRLFIGNDSGVMHIAAAVRTPTLGLFGPSDERLYGPYGEHCAVVRGPRSFETIWEEAGRNKSSPTSLLLDLDVDAAEEAARRLLERTEGWRAGGRAQDGPKEDAPEQAAPEEEEPENETPPEDPNKDEDDGDDEEVVYI
jgi:ADP-heptose:LPS heptosyltransferase